MHKLNERADATVRHLEVDRPHNHISKPRNHIGIVLNSRRYAAAVSRFSSQGYEGGSCL